MAALSAVVFTLSGWLGLYLLSRDPRKPVLALAAIGLCGFALVVALDAVRTAASLTLGLLSRLEIYLVARSQRGVVRRARRAGPAVRSLAGAHRRGVAGRCRRRADPGRRDDGRQRRRAAAARSRADVRGDLDFHARRDGGRAAAAGSAGAAGPAWSGTSHCRDAVLRVGQRHPDHPAGLVPSWLALASTGFDVLLLGVAVALWDAFDEGQALRADMLRSFTGCSAVAVLFGGQVLIGLALTRGTSPPRKRALTVLLFTTLAIALAVQVLADPLAGVLDRLAFSRSPDAARRPGRVAAYRGGAAAARRTIRSYDVDDDTFARLTRRALGHYADLTKLVASPLTALPVIDERLAARGAPDHPLERANELKAVLADAHRAAQAARRRRLRNHRAVAVLQRAVLPLRRRRARLCAERHRRRPGSHRPAGLAMVGDRGPAALAAQLAERRGPADRRRSARTGRRSRAISPAARAEHSVTRYPRIVVSEVSPASG